MFISVPILGLLFTVMILFNRSPRRLKRQRQSIHDDLSSRSISIAVNPLNDPQSSQLKSTFSNDNDDDDDDDDDLIQSDPSSISALNFCANHEIELRLSNDMDDLDMQQV